MRVLVSLLLAGSTLAMSLHAPASAQPVGPVLLQQAQHGFTSKVNGKRYVLQVSLPKGYDAQATTPYPVLYLLDGHLYFPVIATTRALLDLPGALEKVVIVSISDAVDTNEFSWNASRWLDYSPSPDPERDALNSRRYGMPENLPLRSGGAPAFLKVVRTEVIPMMEAMYRVGQDRGIAGHSMGGVFVAYCLTEAPDLFRRYAILSPTHWRNGELQQQIAEKAAMLRADSLVLITWGAQEGGLGVKTAQEIVTLLKARLPHAEQTAVHVFEGEGHHSVVPASLSRVLTALYPAQRAQP